VFGQLGSKHEEFILSNLAVLFARGNDFPAAASILLRAIESALFARNVLCAAAIHDVPEVHSTALIPVKKRMNKKKLWKNQFDHACARVSFFSAVKLLISKHNSDFKTPIIFRANFLPFPISPKQSQSMAK